MGRWRLHIGCGLYVLLPLALLAMLPNPLGAKPKPLPQMFGLWGESAAERYRRLGDEAIAHRDLRKARAAYVKSLELNPNSAGALIGLARVARRQGKDSEAESYFHEALSGHPDDPKVKLAWGRYLFLSKRFDESEEVLRDAARYESVQVKAYLNLADVYLQGKDNPAKAVQSLRAVIEKDPVHAGAHFGLGRTLLRMKKYAEAEHALKTAAKLAPRNPLPNDTLGNLYILRKEYAKALQVFGQSIRIEPHYLPAYFLRGEIYFNQKQYDQALTEYRAILKIQPRNANAQLRAGFVFERQKKNQAATRAFLRTIELDPKQSVAYNNLAWIAALEKTNLDQALIWSKRSLELSPDTPGFLDTLGWVHRARGELSEAAKVLEKAIATSKSPPGDILYHLGVVYQEQGRNREAARYLKQALETTSAFEHRDDARERLDAVTTGLPSPPEIAHDTKR